MRHPRSVIAGLLASLCLLTGCHVAGTGGPQQAPVLSTSSALPSTTSPVSEAGAAAAVPVLTSPVPAGDSAVLGQGILAQVKTGATPPRPVGPGETTLSIRDGTLFTVNACSQQLQAEVTIGRSTLKLAGGIFGGGSAGSPGHPCGDPQGIAFWNDNAAVSWAVDGARLTVTGGLMSLIYRVA